MSQGIEKLERDLAIASRFSAEMGTYLASDILFYPTGPTIPQLTLGGYLMRQHRLLLLRDLLNSAEQDTLDQTVAQAQTAFADHVLRVERHGHQELEARHRQWTEYLRELKPKKSEFATYYASAVETRAMLAALLAQFRLPPYQLDSTVPDRLEALDNSLRARWKPGEFVWPEEWKSAYPASEYWWLYGSPK